jgi:hypothetical protein
MKMEDLTFLLRAAAAEALALDKADPKLTALADLAEDRRGAALIAESRALFAEGISDVRVAVYFLWGAIQEHGLPQLGPVLRVLASMLEGKLAGFGPAGQVDAYARRLVPWLLKKTHRELEYHKVKETERWLAWARAGVEVPIDETRMLGEQLGAEWEVASAALAELASLLRAMQQGLLQKRAPVVQPVELETTAAEAETSSPTPPRATASVHIPSGQVVLQATASFFDLLERMRAFATLTERGDVSRAAILADEITRAIENFDPRLYFPELFSEFSRLLSDHVDELEVAWQARETLAWKVRAQFSQVDLKRFVAGS